MDMSDLCYGCRCSQVDVAMSVLANLDGLKIDMEKLDFLLPFPSPLIL